MWFWIGGSILLIRWFTASGIAAAINVCTRRLYFLASGKCPESLLWLTSEWRQNKKILSWTINQSIENLTFVRIERLAYHCSIIDSLYVFFQSDWVSNHHNTSKWCLLDLGLESDTPIPVRVFVCLDPAQCRPASHFDGAKSLKTKTPNLLVNLGMMRRRKPRNRRSQKRRSQKNRPKQRRESRLGKLRRSLGLRQREQEGSRPRVQSQVPKSRKPVPRNKTGRRRADDWPKKVMPRCFDIHHGVWFRSLSFIDYFLLEDSVSKDIQNYVSSDSILIISAAKQIPQLDSHPRPRLNQKKYWWMAHTDLPWLRSHTCETLSLMLIRSAPWL